MFLIFSFGFNFNAYSYSNPYSFAYTSNGRYINILYWHGKYYIYTIYVHLKYYIVITVALRPCQYATEFNVWFNLTKHSTCCFISWLLTDGLYIDAEALGRVRQRRPGEAAVGELELAPDPCKVRCSRVRYARRRPRMRMVDEFSNSDAMGASNLRATPWGCGTWRTPRPRSSSCAVPTAASPDHVQCSVPHLVSVLPGGRLAPLDLLHGFSLHPLVS